VQVNDVWRFHCDGVSDRTHGRKPEPAGLKLVKPREAAPTGIILIPGTGKYDVVIVGARAVDVVANGDHHAAGKNFADMQYFWLAPGVQILPRYPDRDRLASSELVCSAAASEHDFAECAKDDLDVKPE
jgi:hypothetical protein